MGQHSLHSLWWSWDVALLAALQCVTGQLLSSCVPRSRDERVPVTRYHIPWCALMVHIHLEDSRALLLTYTRVSLFECQEGKGEQKGGLEVQVICYRWSTLYSFFTHVLFQLI